MTLFNGSAGADQGRSQRTFTATEMGLPSIMADRMPPMSPASGNGALASASCLRGIRFSGGGKRDLGALLASRLKGDRAGCRAQRPAIRVQKVNQEPGLTRLVGNVLPEDFDKAFALR